MIAIDWGTSSLRAFRLDPQGQVIDARRSDQGVLASAGRFEAVLEDVVQGWDERVVAMAGMIGSRQGWHEVAYVACPAGLDEIAQGMRRIESSVLRDRELWIAPGLSVVHADGVHDVMRGEETQICGLLDRLGPGSHLACLAGTHCKHLRIDDGRIRDFSTAMTGELFQVLSQHSILGRLMQPGPHDAPGFARGLDHAALDGDLIEHLFAVRTHGLFDVLPASALRSFLSGLLIGHELRGLPASAQSVHLIAPPALLEPYTTALTRRGHRVQVHDEQVSARGLYALARQRGLPMA
ncbi:2-dehydro-3-deoxygalactonokinase [Lysobacter capsici]|uniref:2-dehydro-3-deoxygalactonokinase n=1 Tax=Lysobacter capsici TaxID=435897 RepID=UPI000BBB412F|nr:2-dehydro-3-deoxygalactonokinase [Lysobacter capsici]ATE72155.1 MFS transporter [Lysobacter capsici]